MHTCSVLCSCAGVTLTLSLAPGSHTQRWPRRRLHHCVCPAVTGPGEPVQQEVAMVGETSLTAKVSSSACGVYCVRSCYVGAYEIIFAHILSCIKKKALTVSDWCYHTYPYRAYSCMNTNRTLYGDCATIGNHSNIWRSHRTEIASEHKWQLGRTVWPSHS